MSLSTTKEGTITAETLKQDKVSELKRTFKSLESAIYIADCFGVRDLILHSLISKELARREEKPIGNFDKDSTVGSNKDSCSQ